MCLDCPYFLLFFIHIWVENPVRIHNNYYVLMLVHVQRIEVSGAIDVIIACGMVSNSDICDDIMYIIYTSLYTRVCCTRHFWRVHALLLTLIWKGVLCNAIIICTLIKYVHQTLCIIAIYTYESDVCTHVYVCV